MCGTSRDSSSSGASLPDHTKHFGDPGKRIFHKIARAFQKGSDLIEQQDKHPESKLVSSSTGTTNPDETGGNVVEAATLLFRPVSGIHNQALPLSQSCSPTTKALSIAGIELLGNVHSSTTFVKRDLGFAGQIGRNVILTYGDTLYSDTNYSDIWRGMTSNSVALATHDPLKVVDPHLTKHGYPPQFCPIIAQYGEDPSTHALGITNAVETYPGQGILFFLLNHRPNGVNHLVGAGVATVQLSNTYPPVPKINRLSRFWWDADTEPWYGDVGTIRWNDYIYAYGHAKDNPFVYLTRISWTEATNMKCYKYWNGDNWQRERLMTKDLGEKQAVFWQINQGQVIWSTYFRLFLFVYCDNWMNSKVLVKTASKPEGPWSDPKTLYQAVPITEGSSVYAAVPHPYYDISGKTLVVTFTNHPNLIQAVRVTFA